MRTGTASHEYFSSFYDTSILSKLFLSTRTRVERRGTEEAICRIEEKASLRFYNPFSLKKWNIDCDANKMPSV